MRTVDNPIAAQSRKLPILFTLLAFILAAFFLSACETEGNSERTDIGQNEEQKDPPSAIRSESDDPADLVTKFQYAYFERRFDDFHSLLSEKDRRAKTLDSLVSEFRTLSVGEEVMTTFMLGSSDYSVDSTYTISSDSVVVFGRSEAPLLENVERETSVILRDVGDQEEIGMLVSLLSERLKFRGGMKEAVLTQHLVIKENDEWKVRVGFDQQ